MSDPSTVLVYEYFTAGGFPPGELPAGLAAEALGMLWAILADFHAWGAMRTLTALDPRCEDPVHQLTRHTLPVDEVVCVANRERDNAYVSLLQRCDCALIIAPETDGILAGLTLQAEKAGVFILGSNSSSVATAGNKAACYELFRDAGIPTPRTESVPLVDVPAAAARLGLPLIIKPVDGMGSEGVCRVDHMRDIAPAVHWARRVTAREQLLVQPFIDGIPASVSLLVTKDRCLPLSFNQQLFDNGSRFMYLGSRVPFEHEDSMCGIESACAAVGLIQGLRGYVGVDLLLAGGRAQVIEINPRLTTSYIGLRKVAKSNLAKIITEACLCNILPDSFSLSGCVTIRKNDPLTWF